MAEGMTDVKRAVTIRRSPEELYEQWRDLSSLPEIMSHVKSVQTNGDGRSHWVVEGPAGRDVEWDAETTADEPGRRIAWRTVGDPDVENEGEVLFTPAPRDEGTEVHVHLRYKAPGGAAGKLIAGLYHKDPFAELGDDLRRFKQVMELGRVPTITGQPNGRREEDK
jgi:uncharacterized membrane protein